MGENNKSPLRLWKRESLPVGPGPDRGRGRQGGRDREIRRGGPPWPPQREPAVGLPYAREHVIFCATCDFSLSTMDWIAMLLNCFYGLTCDLWPVTCDWFLLLSTVDQIAIELSCSVLFVGCGPWTKLLCCWIALRYNLWPVACDWFLLLSTVDQIAMDLIAFSYVAKLLWHVTCNL